MKKTSHNILIVFLILCIGCKERPELESIDQLKTAELISDLLESKSKYLLSPSCISEEPRAISGHVNEDFKNYAKEHLKIVDTFHLNNQMRFRENFRISKKIAGELKLLTKQNFEDLERLGTTAHFSFWSWLDENCENGYLSISKPIFNETYDLAIVQIGTVCGKLCGGGGTFIYKFDNGTWKETEILSSWVS